MTKDIVILGFPKCGTSALVRGLERLPDVDLLRTPKTAAMPHGHVEYAWPMFRDLAPRSEPGRIRAHKYTGYVFDKAALTWLAQACPGALFVLCIRQSALALRSWHGMHRRLAVDGNRKDHFAWKERDFYATCTLADYYARYARTRMQYDQLLQGLITILPQGRLAVVSQERLSRDLPDVAERLVRALTGEWPMGAMLEPEYHPHLSYAETADTDLDPAMAEELSGIDTRLQSLITAANLMQFT